MEEETGKRRDKDVGMKNGQNKEMMSLAKILCH